MKEPAWGLVDLEHEIAGLNDVHLQMQLRWLCALADGGLLDHLTHHRLGLLQQEAYRRFEKDEANGHGA